MKFVLKPSLEHRTLVKIAAALWNQMDVRARIAKHDFMDMKSYKEWRPIEEAVNRKVPQLSLPQLLKEKLLAFVKPIGLQILEWFEFHYRRFHLCVNLPGEFSWTPQGTIDGKKTAEVTVKDENLDLSTRYKLACIHCLEDDIPQFWNSLPEDLKVSYGHEFPIISFWSRNMKSGAVGPISYKYQFNESVRHGNEVAAEYFLKKLTPRERQQSLVESEKNVHVDTLRFLISEMNEEQQMELFKNKPCEVLECFLEWPLQSFFIEIANYVRDILSKEDYYDILIGICCKVFHERKDCHYEELFRDIWQEIPSALKSLITNEIDKSRLVSSVFHIRNKEIIRIILKDLTLAVKNNLIYKMISFCELFTHDVEWDFLEFCIRECFPSINEMLKFKGEFKKHPYFKKPFRRYKYKWNQIFRLSDASIFECEKRSVEESESGPSKRFRSLQ